MTRTFTTQPAKWEYDERNTSLREVPGHPNYLVTEDGQIFRKGNTKPRKLIPNWAGYFRVYIDKKTRLVHRLVCMAFHGMPADQSLHAAHKDGDNQNNYYRNLAWATRSENERHKERHGTGNQADRHPMARFSSADIIEMRAMFQAGTPVRKISEQFDCCLSYTHQIVRGKKRTVLLPEYAE